MKVSHKITRLYNVCEELKKITQFQAKCFRDDRVPQQRGDSVIRSAKYGLNCSGLMHIYIYIF